MCSREKAKLLNSIVPQINYMHLVMLAHPLAKTRYLYANTGSVAVRLTYTAQNCANPISRQRRLSAHPHCHRRRTDSAEANQSAIVAQEFDSVHCSEFRTQGGLHFEDSRPTPSGTSCRFNISFFDFVAQNDQICVAIVRPLLVLTTFRAF